MSVSLRVTDCWTVYIPVSEKLPVISLSWFSVAIPHLGTLQGGKYKYFSIFPHFSRPVIFYFLLVIRWLLPTPPSCWIGVHYACHWSIGNQQTLDAAEPFLCWIETTEMIVLSQQLLSLAVASNLRSHKCQQHLYAASLMGLSAFLAFWNKSFLLAVQILLGMTSS